MCDSPELRSFIDEVLERAAAIRVPDLFSGERSDALYRLVNRHGVSVVALRSPSLTSEHLDAILTYRLVQHLLADQLDPGMIFERRLDRGLENEECELRGVPDKHRLWRVA